MVIKHLSLGVHVDTWRSTYRGIGPQDFLDSLSDEKSKSMWRNGPCSAEGMGGL